MGFILCLKFTFYFFIHIVIPLLYISYAYKFWSIMTICYQRVCLCLFIVLSVGMHRCMFFYRYINKKNYSLDIETTALLSIIYYVNKYENNECYTLTNITYLDYSEKAFNIILLCNYIALLLLIALIILASIISFISLLKANARIVN